MCVPVPSWPIILHPGFYGLVIRNTLGAQPYRPHYWLHYQCPTLSHLPTVANGIMSTSTRPQSTSIPIGVRSRLHPSLHQPIEASIPQESQTKSVQWPLPYFPIISTAHFWSSQRRGSPTHYGSPNYPSTHHPPYPCKTIPQIPMGQLFNGTIDSTLVRTPTHASLSVVLEPDSCTHIAGACPTHSGHIIKKHS